jgi:hypothetical protein
VWYALLISCFAAYSLTYGTSNFVTALCGFLTICSGVLLLHLSREGSDTAEYSPLSQDADATSVQMSTLRKETAVDDQYISA